VILAHHMGEDVVLMAAASAAGAGSALLALARARAGELMRRRGRRLRCPPALNRPVDPPAVSDPLLRRR
jgi:hypothetical protein